MIAVALFAGVTAVPVLAVDTPASLAGIATVDAATVKKWLDSGEKMVILDPRKDSDYKEKGHIPTAINCPVGTETDIKDDTIAKTVEHLKACKALAAVDKGKKIVAYCNGAACWMSPKAALALKKMGYTNVDWFRTGVKEWQEKGFPME